MLPDGVLSTNAVPAAFIGASKLEASRAIDYEDGGIALNDPSHGLMYQVWYARIDGPNIVIGADEVAESIILPGVNATSVALAFDSSMRPAIAYMRGNTVSLYWYDTLAGGSVTTEYSDAYNPTLSLDDKRMEQSATRDIIFAYLKSGNLYYRQQRDRYEIEYLLKENVSGSLIKSGMNENLRFQFEFESPPDPSVNPEVMLDISGNTRTWDMNQNWRSMGKKGEYNKRVIWRRLGQHRSFTPRIAISAPVKRAVIAAYADIEPSNS